MGFPKKISQFPINPDLTGQDLLVTVNEFDVTNRINLQQLIDFVIDGIRSLLQGKTVIYSCWW